MRKPAVAGDPQWYRDAVVYQLHVKAFADSNGDGIGDFRGLTQKLDYLQDLGVTALWLLPFYPSPLRDDGYDIADYTDIHPSYGTLADFKLFLRAAHERELKVITELVVNHTSDQHPWFQRARRARPGSPWRDFYVWSDTPEKYKETRVIFQDFEHSNWAWDHVAGQYYWHRFYSHQPDLNFESPGVRKAILQAMDFWLDMGVDGLRLDAVPYLCEREGTNCENLPETHAILREIRHRVDRDHKARMLLAEANQWPEDAAAYFGKGDECHMAFHFPLMPRLFMALRMEDRFPIVDILEQTPAIPDGCQWAIFLRNHDELTLEMVTDEDRDFMYRAYARDPRMRVNLGIRRRLAPLLDNLRRKIELMSGLLLSLPGTPVIYYGDEIGMGDNVYLGDRNGVRTPMQWSADRNAGFSRTNPQQLFLPVITDPEYHYEAVNVDVQENNTHSLLWWFKRMIAQRQNMNVFGRGTMEMLQPENPKVLAFVREYEDDRILVVANLSRYCQSVDLNLSKYAGMTPVEMSGGHEFPPINGQSYFVTLGGHEFFWFALEPETSGVASAGGDGVTTFSVDSTWEEILTENARPRLQRILPAYLMKSRWFGGKGRRIQGVEIRDVIKMPGTSAPGYVMLAEVSYKEGDPSSHLVFIAYADGARAEEIRTRRPAAIVAKITMADGSEGIVHDGLINPEVGTELLTMLSGKRRLRGESGTIASARARAFATVRGPGETPPPRLLGGEQSNSCIVFGDRLIIKVLRQVEPGIHPDVEICKFLSDRTSFTNAPRVAAALEYASNAGEPTTLALLQGYVPNQGDAWTYTLDSLRRAIDETLAGAEKAEQFKPPTDRLLERIDKTPPSVALDLFSDYLDVAGIIGRRTAELHLALASRNDVRDFAPEPFSTLYQQSVYQLIRGRISRTMEFLDNRIRHLPAAVKDDARVLVRREADLFARLKGLLRGNLGGHRIRIHGDYHLGQVLWTGRDIVIFDFEGEPARSLSERRIKRSPLRDVAGMMRSFDYAAGAAGIMHPQAQSGRETIERLGRTWCGWASAAFLRTYLETMAEGTLLPKDPESIETLIDAFLIDKAMYELAYELNNRPDWIAIPLAGILRLLESE